MNIRKLLFLGLSTALVATGCRGAETGDAGGADVGRAPAESPVRDDTGAPIAGETPGADPESPVARDGGPAAGGVTGPAQVPASPGQTAQGGGQQPSTGSVAPAATAPDAAAILRRAEQVYSGVRSMEADFTQNVDVPLLGQSTRSQGKLYHRSPDRFLMQFSDPRGDVVVADGRHLWMYYPSVDARQVMRTTMAAAGGQVDLHREFLSNTTERYNAVLSGQEPVGGSTADVIVLTPRTRSGYRQVRIWVDREDALVRRFEITEENQSVRTLDLRNIRRNPTLPDRLFDFTPPAGAQVFEQ